MSGLLSWTVFGSAEGMRVQDDMLRRCGVFFSSVRWF